MTDALNPWDRRPNESFRQFYAFQMYREMPPSERSIRAVAKLPRVTVSRRSLDTWSSLFDWVDRAGAWDQHVDREAQKAEVEAVKKMRSTHANLGSLMVQLAIRRLTALANETGAIEKIPIPQAVKLAEFGVKFERQARGEPDLTFSGSEAGIGVTNNELLAYLRSRPDMPELLDKIFAEIPDNPGEIIAALAEDTPSTDD